MECSEFKIELEKVAGDTCVDIDELKDKVLKIARETTMSVDEASSCVCAFSATGTSMMGILQPVTKKMSPILSRHFKAIRFDGTTYEQ